MSSNLLKRSYTRQEEGPGRIIDTNALVAQRIGELAREISLPQNSGFTAGLKVEEVDVSALVGEPPQDTGEQLSMTTQQAQEKASDILREAKEAAEKILQDAIEQGEAQRESIREQARARGYEEAQHQAGLLEQELRQEYEEKVRELEKKEAELVRQYDALVEDLEPKFIDTLSGIYEHLFHVELGNYREVLLYLIRDCLRTTEGGKTFQIYVSGEDLPYLVSRKSLLQEAVGNPQYTVELMEDAGLGRNECVIKTDQGIMDCGLKTQLDELTRKLKLLAYEKR